MDEKKTRRREKKKKKIKLPFLLQLHTDQTKVKSEKVQVQKRIQLKSAHIHLCCGPGVCALAVLLLMTGSGCVALSCRHWTKRQIVTPAAAPAPLLCGTPTFPWHNQAALLLCPCPSRACTEAPGNLTGEAACSRFAGCNKEAWPPVCWGRWRRQSLCSGHTG